ncbi:hypothetical protein [Bacillus sp. 37MA]|uniref:hypothetical protein n=1 Tax=Bacillus sp. 37MA TaxID=1132442 RepID=UPI00037B2E37|nr:hypothetical protein [Bacillus sp. 37MA]
MNEIKGYNELTEVQRKLFWLVQRKHLSSMSPGERDKYGTGNIQKVNWNTQDACVEVHFVDGKWWIYASNGTWY